MTRGESIGRWLPTAAGAVLIALGLRQTIASMGLPIGPYDEGLLLTHASLVSQGYAPYRDFYSNYPPGIFLAIAGLWKVFGVSVAAERALGLAAHLVIAGGAGWLAARLRGSRFSTLTAGVVLIWLSWLGTLAFAWLVALAIAVVAVLLLHRAIEGGSRVDWLVAGLALGCVGCFRHDLFVYLVSSLVAVYSAWWLLARRSRPSQSDMTAARWLAMGAAVPLLALWLPTLVRGGFVQVFDDLYRTQVRDVLPARMLPMPDVLALVATERMPFRLPGFLVYSLPGAVALTLIGPVLALLALALAPRLGLRDRAGPALLLALSVAVMPQMLGRTDVHHAIFTVTPSLLLACALLESGLRRPGLGRAAVVTAACCALVLPARTHFRIGEPPATAAWQAGYPRYGGLPEAEPARERVLAFVAANTAPGDPIFVGLTDHRRIYVDELDLYFLADRPGTTRILQFDPNVVNREDVQREMVAQIDAVGARIAVLSDRFTGTDEPNESSTTGSSFLDDFLRDNFDVVEVAGPYRLLRRREPA